MRTVTSPLKWNRILNPILFSDRSCLSKTISSLVFNSTRASIDGTAITTKKNEGKVSVFDLLDDTKCDAR